MGVRAGIREVLQELTSLTADLIGLGKRKSIALSLYVTDYKYFKRELLEPMMERVGKCHSFY